MNRVSTELACLVKDSFALAPTSFGDLQGKKFVVKDCIAIENHISSFGHPSWRSTHAASKTTAPGVSSLLNAGAHMIGIAKLDQLAMSPIGDLGEDEAPFNSLYPDRFAGGSSSGSASAIAGGLADIAIGTDTSGSIRVPAAACGLCSIRPTHGVVDSTGVLSLAPTFDAVGLIAKEPSVLRTAFNTLTTPQQAQPIKRILFPTDCSKLANLEIGETVRATAVQLGKTLEITVEGLDLGSLIEESANDLRGRLQCREIWQQHGEWANTHMDELAPIVQKTFVQCRQLSKSTSDEKAADLLAREVYREAFSELIQPGTVVVLPVIPSLPPKRNATSDELAVFRKGVFWLSAPAGLAGAPQVVAPVKNRANGLTYGVGLLGAVGQDSALLELVSVI